MTCAAAVVSQTVLKGLLVAASDRGERLLVHISLGDLTATSGSECTSRMLGDR